VKFANSQSHSGLFRNALLLVMNAEKDRGGFDPAPAVGIGVRYGDLIPRNVSVLQYRSECTLIIDLGPFAGFNEICKASQPN
jgi:hypothetical protein